MSKLRTGSKGAINVVSTLLEISAVNRRCQRRAAVLILNLNPPASYSAAHQHFQHQLYNILELWCKFLVLPPVLPSQPASAEHGLVVCKKCIFVIKFYYIIAQ